MSRPWLDRVRQLRWVVGTVIVAGVVAVVGVATVGIIWLLPKALTATDASTLGPAERLKAQNDVRTALIAMVVALGAGVTATITVRSYLLGRDRQLTDSLSAAVAHLGEERASVRVGGLHSLERIGRTSERDRQPIIHIIGTFVYERSREKRVRPSRVPEDVAAALAVLGRMLALSRTATVDLRGAELSGADLSAFPVRRTDLTGAALVDAVLPPGV